jgi:hypothetical protein
VRSTLVAGRRRRSSLLSVASSTWAWIILDPGDAEAKGVHERSQRFVRTNFEPGRRFAKGLDFQAQLDGSADKANGRIHHTVDPDAANLMFSLVSSRYELVWQGKRRFRHVSGGAS